MKKREFRALRKEAFIEGTEGKPRVKVPTNRLGWFIALHFTVDGQVAKWDAQKIANKGETAIEPIELTTAPEQLLQPEPSPEPLAPAPQSSDQLSQ